MIDHEERLTQAMKRAVVDVKADPTMLAARARQAGRRRLRRRVSLRVVTAGLAAVIIAIAGGTIWQRMSPATIAPAASLTPAPEQTGDAAPPLLQVQDGEVLVSCGGPPGWKPSVIEHGLVGADRRQFVPALKALVEESPTEAPRELVAAADIDDAPWRVVAMDGSEAVLSVGEDLDVVKPVYLERRLGKWQVTSWSDGCSLEPVLASSTANWVQVSSSNEPADPSGRRFVARPLPGDALDVQVWVRENACASGRDPRPYLREPAFVETPDSVTVYWTTMADDTMVFCPGVAPEPVTLRLPSPLGDRQLLDGSTWPATPLRAEP